MSAQSEEQQAQPKLILAGSFVMTTGLSESDDVAHLPFVKDLKKKQATKDGRRRSFWHVNPTGDYEIDCLTGKAYAIALLQYEMNNGGPGNFLNWISKDMPSETSGIEVGFWIEIGAHAVNGAKLAATSRDV